MAFSKVALDSKHIRFEFHFASAGLFLQHLVISVCESRWKTTDISETQGIRLSSLFLFRKGVIAYIVKKSWTEQTYSLVSISNTNSAGIRVASPKWLLCFACEKYSLTRVSITFARGPRKGSLAALLDFYSYSFKREFSKCVNISESPMTNSQFE